MQTNLTKISTREAEKQQSWRDGEQTRAKTNGLKSRTKNRRASDQERKPRQHITRAQVKAIRGINTTRPNSSARERQTFKVKQEVTKQETRSLENLEKSPKHKKPNHQKLTENSS